jgi:hypothetical protein
VPSLIARLPEAQKPDLVVVLIDAFLTSVPKGLSKVACRKIAYIADTHHGVTPFCRLFAYLQQEPFDRYAMAHDPHHLHWFHEAGFGPIANHLNVSARDTFKPNFSARRERRIGFVGQTLGLHQYRGKLIAEMEKAGLPFYRIKVQAPEAAKVYATSQLTFNTCNGDVNMRVFEAMAVGACLVTDKLSNATGLNAIFRDGEHYITYGSAAELLEKMNYYIDRPEDCLAIARRGHEAYKQHFAEGLRKQRFLEFAFSNDTQARALAAESQLIDGRNAAISPEGTALLQERVLVYEQMQELQSQRLIDHVCLSLSTAGYFASDLSDLVYLSVDRKYDRGALTCCVLQADELAAFVTAHRQDLPDFLFLRPGGEPQPAERVLMVGYGYETFTMGLTTHPGCYQRQRSA